MGDPASRPLHLQRDGPRGPAQVSRAGQELWPWWGSAGPLVQSEDSGACFGSRCHHSNAGGDAPPLSLELVGSPCVHTPSSGQSASWSVEALPSGTGVSVVRLRSRTHTLQVTWGCFIPAVGSSLSNSSASEER